MSFLKRVQGEFAHQRFALEVAAYNTTLPFWTDLAAGWLRPRLLGSDPRSLTIELTQLQGRLCTWDDAIELADRLVVAVRAARLPGVFAGRIDNCMPVLDAPAGLPTGVLLGSVNDWVQQMRFPTVMVQGDLKPTNLLRADHSIAVLDWELARPGVVAEDAASLLTHAILADVRGSASAILVTGIGSKLSNLMPRDVLTGLVVIDLLRQARRERYCSNPAGAELREQLARRFFDERR